MSFLRDKISRNYFRMLVIFSVLFLFFSLIFCIWQTEMTKSILINKNKTVTSALLEQGIGVDVITTALTNTKESEEANLLLQQAGITKQTAFIFFPELRNMYFRTVIVMLPFLLIGIVLLLLAAIRFFNKREQTYSMASKIIKEYAEGDFSNHLPRAESGMLYSLFSSIDQLATALQAKNETEQVSKEFLKNTISDISHQLKTPLAALSMYNEIIIDEPDNIETVTNFSGKTNHALGRMEQLIQALLKITKLDAGNILFEKKRCTVKEIVNQAKESLDTRAQRENKQLIISGSPEDMITCDFVWTIEAIGNLIKNALDHTSSGGHVWISWEQSPALLHLTVRDDGAGIVPEDIHHIFKRFYRSKNSLDTQGVGLGLPLAKSIIEGQGGILSVQSMQGQGTTFTVSFLTKL